MRTIRLALFLGTLSIVGPPPTAGVWSKSLTVEGAACAGEWLIVRAFLLSSLLNIVDLLSIPIRASLRRLSEDAAAHPHGEAPLTARIAMVITATLMVLLLLQPGLAHDPVSRITEVNP